MEDREATELSNLQVSKQIGAAFERGWWTWGPSLGRGKLQRSWNSEMAFPECRKSNTAWGTRRAEVGSGRDQRGQGCLLDMHQVRRSQTSMELWEERRKSDSYLLASQTHRSM